MKQLLFGGPSGSPDSPEWHAWRSGGIGGSDAPVIGHANGLNSRPAWAKGHHLLWLVKTGQIQIPYMSNWATERGKAGEEPARRLFESRTGIILSPIFGEMDKHPPTRASFDGVDFDHVTIGEIKCPSREIHENTRKGIVPDYYFTQMLHQGLVLWGDPRDCAWTGKRFFFISFIPEEVDLVWVEIPADLPDVQAKAARLLDAEMAFWQGVETRKDPAGDVWVEVAEAFVAADLQLSLAKAHYESIKLQVDLLLGDKTEFEGAGISASRGSKAGLVSYKDAVECLMKWYGIYPEDFLPQFKGADSELFSVRVKKAAGKKKGKAQGVLSLEAAQAELARIVEVGASEHRSSYAY